MDKEKSTLKQLTREELQVKLGTYKHDLFTLRLNATTAHVKNYSQFKKVRKNVARVLTYLRQQV